MRRWSLLLVIFHSYPFYLASVLLFEGSIEKSHVTFNQWQVDNDIKKMMTHPSLAVVTPKCISIATMLVGFFDPLSTSPCIFEKHLLGKLWKNGSKRALNDKICILSPFLAIFRLDSPWKTHWMFKFVNSSTHALLWVTCWLSMMISGAKNDQK